MQQRKKQHLLSREIFTFLKCISMWETTLHTSQWRGCLFCFLKHLQRILQWYFWGSFLPLLTGFVTVNSRTQISSLIAKCFQITQFKNKKTTEMHQIKHPTTICKSLFKFQAADRKKFKSFFFFNIWGNNKTLIQIVKALPDFRSTLSCLIMFLCFPGSVNILALVFLSMSFTEGRRRSPSLFGVNASKLWFLCKVASFVCHQLLCSDIPCYKWMIFLTHMYCTVLPPDRGMLSLLHLCPYGVRNCCLLTGAS